VGDAREHRIVVGVDGSESADAALAWAVRQARLTGAGVDAVITWELPVTGWVPDVMDGDFARWSGETLEESVDRAVAGAEASVEVRRHVLCGNAAQTLVDLADGADLLVVGSRGHGSFAGALLGSVSRHCSQHAHCPVVIVRGAKE
jgi:nucleotide-binding universal stress UspA family protein